MLGVGCWMFKARQLPCGEFSPRPSPLEEERETNRRDWFIGTDFMDGHRWGGRRWMAQGFDINGLMRSVFASARHTGPVQGRRSPGEGPVSTRGGLRKLLEANDLRD